MTRNAGAKITAFTGTLILFILSFHDNRDKLACSFSISPGHQRQHHNFWISRLSTEKPSKTASQNGRDRYGTRSFHRSVRERDERRLSLLFSATDLKGTGEESTAPIITNDTGNSYPNIVLVAGFESFNRGLYESASRDLPLNLRVFSDSDIRSGEGGAVNPEFEAAVLNADAFLGSLIFDYDDVLEVKKLIPSVSGPRLLFESATELMTFNRVGTFTMAAPLEDEGKGDGDQGENGDATPAAAPGPPPIIKAILSKFSSGREEDKLQGYIQLLKVGPDLLKYIPGKKASDLKTWLEIYRFWNQGGKNNVKYMLELLSSKCIDMSTGKKTVTPPDRNVEITPDLGLIHPLQSRDYFTSPSEYLTWRLSPETANLARNQKFHLADNSAPRAAVLLYRKHVITEQRYILDLITQMERENILPVPIFINGVEAHTIVRDFLTPSPDHPTKIRVDALINTIGFPLVGGPAGSMQAGRDADLSSRLLGELNVPYIVAGPLLLQTLAGWKEKGVSGLQQVAMYALPELDGAIDTVVLGGLAADRIALVPERVRRLCGRVGKWVELRRTAPKDRRIGIVVYGFPPNVGAVGTAALLDVPGSLEVLMKRLGSEGYDIGKFGECEEDCGQSLVAALGVLMEDTVINGGAENMEGALMKRMERARGGDVTVAETLKREGGGLGGATVRARDISREELDEVLGNKYLAKKVRRVWGEKDRYPGLSRENKIVVAGLQLGNVFLTVQPLLGVEGDPMRLLFERDLTPHPQYCAAYEWMKMEDEGRGGMGIQALVHFGMHGTVEWLPGIPLGNDASSWSDVLMGDVPNLYLYAVNNPSESILAKRRGYGTLVSYNVPPYGRAGLYLTLKELQDVITEYRETVDDQEKKDLREVIFANCQKCEIAKDVPLPEGHDDLRNIPKDQFDTWLKNLSSYLLELQNRLFSQGLHTFGSNPTSEELTSYIDAYFGDKLSPEECHNIVSSFSSQPHLSSLEESSIWDQFQSWWNKIVSPGPPVAVTDRTEGSQKHHDEARQIISLLNRTTDELTNLLHGLSGGYIPAGPGGDLLRDGSSVLPTGKNIHALDPYRMPCAGAWTKGQRIADKILEQHLEENGEYPETVAVTLWGLDSIKTRGESVAIALSLVGAKPVKEGTGRVVRFDLVPLEELGRPRIDILASMSGIFRDSFANIVDLLDDMFERASTAPDEPISMNYIKKHTSELSSENVPRPSSRLFSNPPGDYGSMVNEIVGSGDWEDSTTLGETWRSRNLFSYGKSDEAGVERPEVLDKLLGTSERVVQQVDSVEYGITDIQEYYANTGALKKAAENTAGRKNGKRVTISVVEAFGGSGDDDVPVRDLDQVLRLEYRTKFLNPKWRDAMLKQGSGGAYEISQRMTAMVGWAATTDEVDNFVFDQAAERYALDEEVAELLRKSNPEAFKNVVRRFLEAAGRGMWETDEETLGKLRDLYADVDDLVEQVR